MGNSVVVPVDIKVNVDDVAKNYKNAINQAGSISQLEKMFNDFSEKQKKIVDELGNIKDSSAKAFNIRNLEIYSDFLNKIISEVKHIDKTQLDKFQLPTIKIDGQEIKNVVNEIHKSYNTAIKEYKNSVKSSSKDDFFDSLTKSSGDSVKEYFKERTQIAFDSFKKEGKGVEKLIDAYVNLETITAKLTGRKVRSIEKVIPSNVLEKIQESAEGKKIDLTEIWSRKTPDENITKILNGITLQLKSFAKGFNPIIDDSNLINVGEFEAKIKEGEKRLEELASKWNEFKAKDNEDLATLLSQNNQLDDYLNTMYEIRSVYSDIEEMYKVIGAEPDSLKKFNITFSDDAKAIAEDNGTEYIYDLFDDNINNAMAKIPNDTKSKIDMLNSIDKVIKSINIIKGQNNGTIEDALKELFNTKEAPTYSFDKILKQRNKIIESIKDEQDGLKNLKEQAENTYSYMFQAEEIRNHDFIGFAGGKPSGFNSLGNGDGDASSAEIEELRSLIEDLTERVNKLETETPEGVQNHLNELKEDIKKVNNKIDEDMRAKIDAKTLREAHSYVEQLSKIIDSFNSNSNIVKIEEKFAELTATVNGFVEALSQIYGKDIIPKFSQGNTPYITNEDGTEKIWYRGVNGMMGNGTFSTGYGGAVFLTDNLEVASKAYAGSDGKGKIEKAKIIAKKTWEIDGDRSSWREIEYLGNNTDEASQEISSARWKMESSLEKLSKIVEFTGVDIEKFKPTDRQLDAISKNFGSIVKDIGNFSNDERQKIEKQIADFEQAKKDYLAISNDPTNPYGIHSTDDFVEYAKQAKDVSGQHLYDSILFKDIYDGTEQSENQLSTVGVVLSQDQLHYIETLAANGEKILKEAANNTSDLINSQISISDNLNEQQVIKNQSDFGKTAPKEIDAVNSISVAVTELSRRIEDKTESIKAEAEAMKQAAEVEIAAINSVQAAMMTPTSDESKNNTTEQPKATKEEAKPDIAHIVNYDSDTIKTEAIKNEQTQMNISAKAEVEDLESIKVKVKEVQDAIEKKTEAIAAEKLEMESASIAEIQDVENIRQSVNNLKNDLTTIPPINLTGETDGVINVSVDVTAEQIKAIRQKLTKGLNDKNAIPLSFIPEIESVKKQISNALKDIPIEISSKNIKNAVKIEKFTAGNDGVKDLKEKIGKKLTNIEIQSFKINKDADKIKTLKNEVSKLLNKIEISFDIEKLKTDIESVVSAATEQVRQSISAKNVSADNDVKVFRLAEYNELDKQIKKAKKGITELGIISKGIIPTELSDELSDISTRLNGVSALPENANTEQISNWNYQSEQLLETWEQIKDRIYQSMTQSGKIGEANIANTKSSDYTRKKTRQLNDFSEKNKGKLTDQQFSELEKMIHSVQSEVDSITENADKYTANNVESIESGILNIKDIADSYKNANTAYGSIQRSISKLTTSRNSLVNRGSDAEGTQKKIDEKIAELQRLQSQFATLNWGDPESVTVFINNINKATTDAMELKNVAQNIKIGQNEDAGANKLKTRFDELIFKIEEFRKKNSRLNSDKILSAQFDALTREVATSEITSQNLQKLNAEFARLQNTVTSKGKTGRSLGDEISYIMEKIGLKAMLGGGIYDIINAFKQMAAIVKELDTGMTNLKRVSNETEKVYSQFLSNTGDRARNLGATMTDVVNATTGFSRLGYDLEEASKLADNAMMYKNVGEIDVDTATADIISAIKAYDMVADDSEHIVDVFNKLGKYIAHDNYIGQSLEADQTEQRLYVCLNKCNLCVTTAGRMW